MFGGGGEGEGGPEQKIKFGGGTKFKGGPKILGEAYEPQ